MSENEIRSKLKKFYNAFEDQPVGPSNPYYYPFLQESDSDPIAELANRISFSASESVNLFSGQRGCGKSTEFRRLKLMLEKDGCEVFLLDMQNYMNLTSPVEINDFLISIMIALNDKITERHQKSLAKESYLERLKEFLSEEVRIDSLGIGNIKASLKDDPSFKKQLQENLQGHTARIVSQAHKFVQEAVTLIRKEAKDKDKKVILLIDSVEQIRGVGVDGAVKVHKSVENLFSGHASGLQIPMIHIVYTIPPYLTALVPGIGRQLGGAMACTLPSIHVQNKDGTIDGAGLDIMSNLVSERFSEWTEIFSKDQLNTLSTASGGDLRDFFRLLRAAIVKAGNTIPVQETVIKQTLNHLRREMMPLANDDKKWLRKIDADKDANLQSIEKLPDLARFFDTNLVLNYRNGDDWYGIHPLLKDEIKE